MASLRSYEDWLVSLSAKRDLIKKGILDLRAKHARYVALVADVEEANLIAQTVAQETQKALTVHISDLVTHALQAVFDDKYEFELRFVQKRSKTEAQLLFTRDGNPIEPMDSCGGGLVDIAAFALRLSLLMLQKERLPLLILDEPFRFISEDLQPKAALLVKELSQKLHIQIIMVTHNESLMDVADRTFIVKQDRQGISSVEVIDA